VPGSGSGRDKLITRTIALALTLELPENKEAALRANARARGVSAEEYATELLDRCFDPEATPAAVDTLLDSRPVWEALAEIMKDVPAEDLAILPKDGASQINHYVYGLPKRDV